MKTPVRKFAVLGQSWYAASNRMPGIVEEVQLGAYADGTSPTSRRSAKRQSARIRLLGAALRWLDAHPRAEPQFHGYKGVYGILAEDNKDAKALSKAATDAAGGDCTGAMHQAVLSRAMWIRAHSWEQFCERMRADRASASAAV